jgi:Zn finger protein HypA/HybF involved in hydrogenase expression
MEALVKGSHAPRVTATCEKCGSSFERSAVHPYIVTCPECRGTARRGAAAEREASRRVRCPDCRRLIAADGGLGMRRCPRCREQWWSMPHGVWRNWSSDEVFALGRYAGTVREEDFRAVYAKALQVLDSIVPSVL